MEQNGVAKTPIYYSTLALCLLFFLIGFVGCQQTPPARFQITIEGKGDKIIRETAGSGTCLNSYTTAQVGVSISGGTAGNTITGNAFCGGKPGATASVTDSGTGAGTAKTATGSTITGMVATCTHVYTGIADSHWLVTCDFY